jgi:hypothetical protein
VTHTLLRVELFTSVISITEFIYSRMIGDVIIMNGGSPGPLKNWNELRKKLVKFYHITY